MEIVISEMTSASLSEYKTFFLTGLLNDEDNFRITPGDDLDSCFATRDTVDSFTFAAYINGQLAGVASFNRDGYDREKLRHKGTLFRIYVSLEFRGAGVASRLLTGIIKKVRDQTDIEQINLTVITNNVNAKRIYEKFGFRKFASEPKALKWRNKYFAEDQMVLNIKR